MNRWVGRRWNQYALFREVCKRCGCFGIAHTWGGNCPVKPNIVRANQQKRWPK